MVVGDGKVGLHGDLRRVVLPDAHVDQNREDLTHVANDWCGWGRGEGEGKVGVRAGVRARGVIDERLRFVRRVLVPCMRDA